MNHSQNRPEVLRSQVGPLKCVQVQMHGPKETVVPADLVVVFCHGYGAGGEDLVPVAGEVLSCLPHEMRPRVRFVMPAAPIVMGQMYGMDSRAWWPIDMEELDRAIQTGTFRELRTSDIPEMDLARQKLQQCLKEILDDCGLDWSRTILGGFSQGSMVTTDLTLNLEQTPAGLIVWSGTVIREAKWAARLEKGLPMPVIQSHGKQDPILPYAGAELLRDLLTKAKADVRFLPFMGPHTIPPEGITAAAQLIGQTLNPS